MADVTIRLAKSQAATRERYHWGGLVQAAETQAVKE
jgi:hypothetical protein